MKQWLKGANAAVLSVAVVGIFILLTIFLHSLKGVQWDLTANKKFTLSDQTVTTLKNLNQDVHAIAFTESGQGVVSRQIQDLLDEYHKQNSKFTWEQVDPKKKPTLAQQYNINSYGTIVFTSGGKTKSVSSSELFGGGADQSSYTFNGEAQFTQAILGLISGEKHTGYLLTGHGELTRTQTSQFIGGLGNQGLDVKDLNLFKDGAVPGDAETIFVLSPQKDISDKEADLLKNYVKDKGKLYITLDIVKDFDKFKNWNAVLESIGVKNQNALVVETQKTLSTDPLTIVPAYASHDITSKLEEAQRIVVFPGAMALAAADGNADFKAGALLQTSDQGYGKTNLSVFTSGNPLKQDDIRKTDADLKGPLDLAYAVTDKDNKPKAIVVGNGVFMHDDWIGQQANEDFALNSAGWLQERKELVTIRPKEENAPAQAFITPSQTKLIFYGTVVGFPLLFLVAGGAIWWRRRKG